MSRSRNMPSPKKVLLYWKSLMDVEEGKCFACKKVGSTYRAHILSVCSGGSDKEENLHLLCAWCHLQSEMLEGETYWNWFNKVPALIPFDWKAYWGMEEA